MKKNIIHSISNTDSSFRMRKLPRFGTSDRKDNRQLPGDRKGCPRDGDGHIRPSVV